MANPIRVPSKTARINRAARRIRDAIPFATFEDILTILDEEEVLCADERTDAWLAATHGFAAEAVPRTPGEKKRARLE